MVTLETNINIDENMWPGSQYHSTRSDLYDKHIGAFSFVYHTWLKVIAKIVFSYRLMIRAVKN